MHQWGDSVVNVSLAQSFNSDSSAIHATPSGMLARGDMYMLEVRLDYVTGDSADHILIPLNANLRSKLTFGKVRYGGGTLPASTRIFPDSGDVYFPVGDSISIMAGYPGEGYTFKYWSSPGNTAIHQNTAASLKILQPCRDLSIEAVFEQIAVDSLRAYADSNGRVVLYSSRWDSLSTNTGRLVHRQDSVWAIAIPDSGHVFDKWESVDTNYNNATPPLINIRNIGGAISVRGRFRPATGADEYSYCGSITNPPGVTGVLAVLTPTSGCHTSDQPNNSGTITATMIDPTGINACYRIVRRIDPDGRPQYHQPDGTTEDSKPWALLKSKPVVQFILGVKKFTLTVNKQMDDNSAVPKEAYVMISPDKPQYDCGESVTLTAVSDEVAGVKFLRWEPSMSTSKTLTLTMSENRNITAIFESDFRLVSHQWYITSETQIDPPLTPFQPAFGVQIRTMNPPSTYMVLNFSRAVDQTKLTDPDLGFSRIQVVENSARIDSRTIGFGREQIYTPQSSTFTQWSEDGKSVRMLLTNSATNLPVRKLQQLAIYLNGLESTTGAKMKPPTLTLLAETENPDVIWAIDPLIITYDQDAGAEGEIFSGWVAGHNRGGVKTMTKGRNPESGHEKVSAPPAVSQTIHLMSMQAVASTDEMSAGIITLDEENGESVKKIGGIVQSVANVVANSGAGFIIPEIKLGAQILSAIGGAMKDSGWGPDDDLVGYANWSFNQYYLWGLNASDAQLNITSHTAIFKLKVTLQ